MGIAVTEQCLCLLAATLLGFFLGLNYEVFRILRAAFRHANWLVSVEDFFFCLYCTFSLILLCYAYADGTIRWFALVGGALGALFYFLTLGRLIERMTHPLIAAIHRVLRALAKRLLLPLYHRVRSLFVRLCAALKTQSALRRQARSAREDRRIKHRLSRDISRTNRKFKPKGTS